MLKVKFSMLTDCTTWPVVIVDHNKHKFVFVYLYDWHSSLTAAESHKIENIQKTSLNIILAEGHVDYLSSCELSGLQKLSDRRETRCLAFAKRCLLNPQTKDMFPLNIQGPLNLRNTEKYVVNFARTENYRNSAVPYCQRLLNEDYRRTEDRARMRQQGRTTAGLAPGQGRGEDRARREG